VVSQDLDEINDMHYLMFDNDLLKVEALEKKRMIDYYASLSSIVRTARRRAEQVAKGRK